MKANLILSCLLAAGLTSSARAQLFDDATARNVLFGGIAGAVIGDNNHHQAAAGAAIGAAAGLLWSLATVPADTPVVAAPGAVVCAPPRVVAVAPPPVVVVPPPFPPRPVVWVREPRVRVRVVTVVPAHRFPQRVVDNSRRHRRDRD